MNVMFNFYFFPMGTIMIDFSLLLIFANRWSMLKSIILILKRCVVEGGLLSPFQLTD